DHGHAADRDGALVLLQQEQRHGRGRHQGVKDREHVARHDPGVIGPLGARRAVDLALAHAPGNLGERQTGVRIAHGAQPTFPVADYRPSVYGHDIPAPSTPLRTPCTTEHTPRLTARPAWRFSTATPTSSLPRVIVTTSSSSWK